MTDNPFDQPAPPGASYPTMKQLDGRLLVIFPKHIESVADTFNQGQMKDRLTADVVFLDGDPITHIEKQGQAPAPLDAPISKGTVMRDMFISQGALIGQVKGRKRVLGRLGHGTATKPGLNPPWVLGEQTADDQALALRWWTKVGQAAFEGAGAPQAAPVAQAAPAPAAAPPVQQAPAQAPTSAPAAAPVAASQAFDDSSEPF